MKIPNGDTEDDSKSHPCGLGVKVEDANDYTLGHFKELLAVSCLRVKNYIRSLILSGFLPLIIILIVIHLLAETQFL